MAGPPDPLSLAWPFGLSQLSARISYLYALLLKTLLKPLFHDPVMWYKINHAGPQALAYEKVVL